MSILGKRQRWLALFFGGLLATIALSFASITAMQPSAEAATRVWGDLTAPIHARVLADSASSHQEPNFYQ